MIHPLDNPVFRPSPMLCHLDTLIYDFTVHQLGKIGTTVQQVGTILSQIYEFKPMKLIKKHLRKQLKFIKILRFICRHLDITRVEESGKLTRLDQRAIAPSIFTSQPPVFKMEWNPLEMHLVSILLKPGSAHKPGLSAI